MFERQVEQKIIDVGLTKFCIKNKDARHPDTVDFVIGVLLDLDKNCAVRRITFDHKNSQAEQHPILKAMRLDRWDDAEYRISYRRRNLGLIGKLFSSTSSFDNMPALRRSDIETISSDGSNCLIVSTKTNDHVLHYSK